MSSGLEITLKFLTKTKNDAASVALVPALDSPRADVREGALRAILERRSLPGEREIIRRLHTIDERWREILDHKHPRMTTVLRDSLQTGNTQDALNACAAAVWFHEYELIPALLTIAEDESHAHRELAAQTIARLADGLYEDLTTRAENPRRDDTHATRERVLSALAKSAARFNQVRRGEILEAFLLLAQRDNASLRAILHDPLHPTFTGMIEMLTRSERVGVMRLILSFMDDPQTSLAGIHVLARRSDARFIDVLLRRVQGGFPSAALQNLKRIDSISWLAEGFGSIDESLQCAAVALASRCNLRQADLLRFLKQILQQGGVEGRRAAAEALAAIPGSEASAAAVTALEDDDPQVQASVATQLRPRGIPGAMTKLIALLDSPHEVVRQAARAGLNEYTFPNFLRKFDWMSDANRQQSGLLVARVDLETPQRLTAELRAASRTRRLRALAATRALGLAANVEEIIDALLLDDDDHLVRMEAAKTLADCDTPSACAALRAALLDRSLTVQESAEESLQAIIRRRPHFAADGPNTVRAAESQPAPELLVPEALPG